MLRPAYSQYQTVRSLGGPHSQSGSGGEETIAITSVTSRILLGGSCVRVRVRACVCILAMALYYTPSDFKFGDDGTIVHDSFLIE
jgi:hypothetical protein